MRILFVATKHHVPEAYGGIQSNTHHLCLRLESRGHAAAVFAWLDPGGRLRIRNRVKSRLLGRSFPSDRSAGYPVYRGYPDGVSQGLSEAIADFRPDVLVYQSWNTTVLGRITDTFPVEKIFVWLHGVRGRSANYEIDGEAFQRLRPFARLRWIVNGPYVRDVVRAQLGIDAPIVRPIFGCARYRTVPRANAHAALFSSLNAQKGVGVVVALARARPDVPFVITETWTEDPVQRQERHAEASACRNVVVQRTTPDMSALYAATRVLLMPSRALEGWGRMVTEAQSCGIPVLASRQGNLPDTVGPGGICLDRDAPLADWLEAFSQVWDDKERYGRLSALALEWSQREEVREDKVVADFETIVATAC